MSETGEERDEEVEEVPGVEEWLVAESEADQVADGLDGPSSQP